MRNILKAHELTLPLWLIPILTVEHSMLDAEDQVMALQEDRQGLGLSRRQTGKA